MKCQESLPFHLVAMSFLFFASRSLQAITQVPSSPPTRYAAHVENWSRAQDEKVYPGI